MSTKFQLETMKGRDHSEDLGEDKEDKERLLTGLGLELITDCCEYGHKSLGSTTGRVFLLLTQHAISFSKRTLPHEVKSF